MEKDLNARLRAALAAEKGANDALSLLEASAGRLKQEKVRSVLLPDLCLTGVWQASLEADAEKQKKLYAAVIEMERRRAEEERAQLEALLQRRQARGPLIGLRGRSFWCRSRSSFSFKPPKPRLPL